MPLSLSFLFDLARDTFANPRAGMRRVLNLGLSRGISFELLVLTAVISAILSEITTLLTSAPGGSEMIGGPLAIAIMQLVLLILIVVGIDRGGRRMGGQGDSTGAVLVVVWMQGVMIALQLLQLVMLVLVPPLGAIIGIVSVAVFFWLMTNFVAELHGFRSRILVFLMLLVGFIGLAIFLTLVLSMLGVVPQMEMM